MAEYFKSELPDLTGMTLSELLTTQDPAILAALERVIASVGREPEVLRTEWDENGHPHPLY